MFSLDDKQFEKLSKWQTEQEVKAEEMQGKKPYYGAIGGELTYSFTPTSLGMVVKVKHGYTEQEIDLSDYEDW